MISQKLCNLNCVYIIKRKIEILNFFVVEINLQSFQVSNIASDRNWNQNHLLIIANDAIGIFGHSKSHRDNKVTKNGASINDGFNLSKPRLIIASLNINVSRSLRCCWNCILWVTCVVFSFVKFFKYSTSFANLTEANSDLLNF